MWQRYRLVLVIMAVVVCADQLSKWYIGQRLELYQSLTVVEHYFNICHVHNNGAAFGILADSAIRVPLLIAVALLASGVILWLLARLPLAQRWQRLGLALVFSGAVGNLIDRIRLGVVVDFIDVHWYGHHWPAFNVADSAISVGVALLLLDVWRSERGSRAADKNGCR